MVKRKRKAVKRSNTNVEVIAEKKSDNKLIVILKKLNIPVVHISILTLITLFYTWHYFSMLMSNNVIGGWDGTYHYAITKVYAEQIFPDMVGWIHTWNTGMPWPVGYPPFLSILGGVWNAFGLNVEWLFRYLFPFLTITIPGLTYILAKRLKFSNIESFIAGLLGMFFIISSGELAGVLGVSMGGTFENGLYPQFLAGYFMIIWLIFFVKSFDSQKDWWLASFMMGIIFLTNVHIAEPVVAIFGVTSLCWWIYKNTTLKFVLKQAFSVLLSLGLTLFWLLPLFETRKYFLTGTIGNVPFLVGISSIGVVLILATFSGIKAIKQDQIINFGLYFSGLVILLITVLPLHKVLPSLPLQPFRLLPITYYLCTILAPRGLSIISRYILKSENFAYLGYIILLLPFIYWYPPVDKVIGGIYQMSQNDFALLEHLYTLKDGRTLFEAHNDLIPTSTLKTNTQPTHFMLTALLGTKEHQTVWGVFRESSIQAPFIQPVRNTFSTLHEAFGITCWLCTDGKNAGGYKPDDFYKQPLDNKIALARFFGVRYLVLRSNNQYSAELFTSSKQIEHIRSLGNWNVFTLTGSAELTKELSKPPILLYAPIKSTIRPVDGYDWYRIQEEWMVKGRLDVLFAKASTEFVDDLPLEDATFETVFLSEYKIRDNNKAEEAIRNFAKEKKVIISDEETPLFNRLCPKNECIQNVTIFKRTGDVRIDLSNLIDSIPVSKDANNEAINTTYSKNKVKIQIEGKPQRRLLLVKTAYFPWWKSNNARIYHATTGYMFVITESNEIELSFIPSRLIGIGGIFTLISLLTYLVGLTKNSFIDLIQKIFIITKRK